MSSLCTLAAAVVACIGKSLPPSAPQVPGVGRVFWGPSRGWMLSPVFSPNHPDKAVWLAASASEQGNPAEATWLLSHFSNPFSTLLYCCFMLQGFDTNKDSCDIACIRAEQTLWNFRQGFDQRPGYLSNFGILILAKVSFILLKVGCECEKSLILKVDVA